MTQAQVPPWQAALERKRAGAVWRHFQSAGIGLTEGALPLKVKILMTMLCDAILAHPDGVAGIAQRARAAGASEAEIAETVGVAFIMGGMPGLVTGANAFRD